jgi:hypothetical protein
MDINRNIMNIVADRITAVAPIIRITFPSLDKPSTWQIDFKPEATRTQRQEAQKIIDDFDVTWESRAEAFPEAWVSPAKKRVIQALLDDPEAQQLTKAEWMDILLILGVITYERQRDGSMNWKPL